MAQRQPFINRGETMIDESYDYDIEQGGEFYEARLLLEKVAKLMGEENITVKPFGKIKGPRCVLSSLGGDLWIRTETIANPIFRFEPFGKEHKNKENIEFSMEEIESVLKRIKSSQKIKQTFK